MKTSFLSYICFIIWYAWGYAQSTASAQVSTFCIEAPQLKTEKKIWVYLPKNYKHSNHKYPVIYMHDAQNIFDATTSYAGEWNVDEYLDSISENTAIIIGIEHGEEKRLDELTPYSHDQYGGGHADSYLDFMVFTLKPYVNATYRTLNAPEHTTIIGSSLGGLVSFYAILKYPEVFGNAGVFSPSFWFNHRIFELVGTTDIPPYLRFYFVAGTEESESMVPDIQKMAMRLEHYGVSKQQLKIVIVEGGVHNEELWRDSFPEAYQWLITNQ